MCPFCYSDDGHHYYDCRLLVFLTVPAPVQLDPRDHEWTERDLYWT